MTTFEQTVFDACEANRVGANGMDWDFVDADVFMATKPANSAEHYDAFDAACDKYEEAYGPFVAARMETAQ